MSKNTAFSFLAISFLFVLFCASCQNAPERPDTILTQDRIDAANADVQAAAGQVIQGNSLPHYYCSNSCEGSGGDAAGNCPVCGTTYVHNEAFHNRPNNTATNTITTPTTVTPGADGITVPPITTTTSGDSGSGQNAQGVWHYTCSNGCSGGAGSQSKCGSCGSDLVHNQAYHNS